MSHAQLEGFAPSLEKSHPTLSAGTLDDTGREHCRCYSFLGLPGSSSFGQMSVLFTNTLRRSAVRQSHTRSALRYPTGLENILGGGLVPLVQVKSIREGGIQLADGLVIPSACIFLDGQASPLECTFEIVERLDQVRHAASLRPALRAYQVLAALGPCESHTAFSYYAHFEPMDTNVRQQKRRDIALSSLGAAIETLNLAKEISSITPAKAVFGSVSIILTTIKVSFLLRHLCWSIAD